MTDAACLTHGDREREVPGYDYVYLIVDDYVAAHGWRPSGPGRWRFRIEADPPTDGVTEYVETGDVDRAAYNAFRKALIWGKTTFRHPGRIFVLQ
jgi:hypothetical protein